MKGNGEDPCGAQHKVGTFGLDSAPRDVHRPPKDSTVSSCTR